MKELTENLDVKLFKKLLDDFFFYRKILFLTISFKFLQFLQNKKLEIFLFSIILLICEHLYIIHYQAFKAYDV